MAVTLTGAGGLFTRLGKYAGVSAVINTWRGTTLVADVKDATDQFDNVSNDLLLTFAGVPPALDGGKAGLDGLMSAIQSAVSRLIIQMVKDDTTLNLTEESALRELIRQMVASSDSVDLNAIGVTPTAGGSNNGNGTLIVSTKRGDGKVNENALGETITVECTADTVEFGATFTASGQAAAPSKLSHLWPMGSGASRSLTELDVEAAGNLVTNGSFEDEEVTDTPDSWDIAVGTVGTTLKVTDVEVQTVAITGSPTGGYYVLKYTNPSSKVQYTDDIAYDATASDVQAALRELVGLDLVEVTATGTTPNFTHSVEFLGSDHGNLTVLAHDNYLTGGSSPTVTHGTTTQGSAFVFRGGKALEFDSNGSQLTEIRQVLTTLKPLTQYAVNLNAMADVVPAAGVLTVDFYDGSAIINDEEGTANSFTFTGAGLTTSYVAKNGFFRTPRVLPPVVMLRIRISTAVSSGTSVFIDSVAVAESDELYPGGPHAKMFAGNLRFRKGSIQARGDVWTIAVTNDRLGLFQEWFERWLNMREKGLLLPTHASETIDDALVS